MLNNFLLSAIVAVAIFTAGVWVGASATRGYYKCRAVNPLWYCWTVNIVRGGH